MTVILNVQNTKAIKPIVLIQGLESDQPCWFYVRLDSAQSISTISDLEGQDIDVATLGTVLESDLGETPPDDVRRYMQTEYDCVAA
jgi:hypothetical protein